MPCLLPSARVFFEKMKRGPRVIRHLMTVTEIGMLLYWMLAAALVLSVLSVPPEYMYSDYENPLVVAWNWSFFPIDVAFAVLGLVSRYATLRPGLAQQLALIGATLMFCAGIMAISFWIMTGEFDPLWWGLNLWLILLSLTALRALLKENAPA